MHNLLVHSIQLLYSILVHTLYITQYILSSLTLYFDRAVVRKNKSVFGDIKREKQQFVSLVKRQYDFSVYLSWCHFMLTTLLVEWAYWCNYATPISNKFWIIGLKISHRTKEPLRLLMRMFVSTACASRRKLNQIYIGKACLSLNRLTNSIIREVKSYSSANKVLSILH